MNISIDALDPELYSKLTGGRLDAALEGIGAAARAGFEVVTLNCVLLRGYNEDQIVPLALSDRSLVPISARTATSSVSPPMESSVPASGSMAKST